MAYPAAINSERTEYIVKGSRWRRAERTPFHAFLGYALTVSDRIGFSTISGNGGLSPSTFSHAY